MVVGRILSQRALITPDREALIFSGKVFTYRELNSRTNRLANALLELGVKPGERVGLLMFNSNTFLETYFATAKMGAVLVPLNTRLVPPEFDFILGDCGVSAFIFGQAFEEKVAEMSYPHEVGLRISTGTPSLPDTLDYETVLLGGKDEEPSISVEEEDMQVIMYTSGTTGYPKGAMLSHSGMYAGALNLLVGLSYHYPDRCLLLVPLFHSGAITPFLGHVIRGISTVLMESFEASEALRLIQDKKIRHLLGVTAIMQMILQVPGLGAYDLSSWKYAMLPGSPLPYTLINESHDRIGVLCQNLWGLTEMSGPGSLMNEEDILQRPECAGKPFFSVDIRIAGPDGRDLGPGDLGEIVVKGPNMMQGYWERPEATRKTIIDGWLHTGDMGKLDEEGYLYVVDRIKDMILSGGENVYPSEIERIIREIPGVRDVSVIGIPDEKWGEVPKAFIEAGSQPPPAPEEVIGYCRSKLAGYKVPKKIEFIKHLPRNPSGKVLKKDLRVI